MRAGWFIPLWPIPLEVPPMSTALLTDLVIFVLSLWVGFEVISKVPATLHTPLMSAANSIHGIVLVRAMPIAAGGDAPAARMLKMFRRRPTARAATPAQPAAAPAPVPVPPQAPAAAAR